MLVLLAEEADVVRKGSLKNGKTRNLHTSLITFT